MKPVLIHNPCGGYNRRHASQLPALARTAGIPCWEITGPDDLATALPEIAREQPDLLIVNGGDGTVDAVVTALRGTTLFAREPMLALLPGGTTNMIARDVGFSDPPERAWPRITQALAAGTEGQRIMRSPLVVQERNGSFRQWGFFLGGGALPRLLRKVQERVHARGFISRGGEVFALMQTTSRLFFGDVRQDPVMAPRQLHWSTDQKPEENLSMVLYMITTLDRLVLGINPARPEPGLRFLALRHPYRRIISSVTRLLRRKPFDAVGDDFLFREGRSMTLRHVDEAVLDGELLPLTQNPATLELELAPPLTFWRL